MSIRRRLMMQGKIAYTYIDASYICNENGGYIETGYAPNQNTRVVMDWMPIENKSTRWVEVFGSGSRDVGDSFFVLRNPNNYNRLQPTFGGGYQNLSNQTQNNVRYTIDFNKNVFKLNSWSVTLTSYTFQSVRTLHLFETKNQNHGRLIQRIFSCQIYNNGTIIRDYVPKLRSDGKYGLWDKIEEKFYLSPNNIDFVGALTE